MRCMYNAEEKLEDAVRLMASRYYNNLSYNYKDSDSIAAFYAAEAVSVGCSAAGGGLGAGRVPAAA